MAAAFIAREFDQGKQVAIIWTTLGDGGTNEVGPEQVRAMGDIREVETMRGAASLAITNMEPGWAGYAQPESACGARDV